MQLFTFFSFSEIVGTPKYHENVPPRVSTSKSMPSKQVNEKSLASLQLAVYTINLQFEVKLVAFQDFTFRKRQLHFYLFIIKRLDY